MLPKFLIHLADTVGNMLKIDADGTIYGKAAPHAVRYVRTLINGKRQVGTVRSVLGVWIDRTDGKAPVVKSSAKFRTLFAAIERDPRCKIYDTAHPESAPIADKIVAAIKVRYSVQG